MASDASDHALKNIREYVEKAKRLQQEAMDMDDTSSNAVEARLTSTITALQNRVEQRQAELTKLRASASTAVPTVPSADAENRLRQLRIIQDAYERMTPEKPDLPSRVSALPSLLAARVIQGTIKETRKSILSIRYRLESAERQLKQEEAEISDSKVLSEALKARSSRLEKSHMANLVKSSSDKAKELVRAKQKQRDAFMRDAAKLRKILDQFLDEHLAAMLAAEDIGGPVVGEMMDVDEDMLTAGFSAQGRPKSSKSTSSESDAKRQRRIDDIWGTDAGSAHETEKDAAAEMIRRLLGELLAQGGYVELERDSAVARFLVRAKVAQYHPKDAKRIRLIDFSRELDE